MESMPNGEAELPPVVMVVDNDGGTLEMYQELLSSEGVWVTGTTRIDEAFEFARDLQPDAVLSDLVFTGDLQEGVNFIRQLRAEPRLTSVPVVLVLDSTVADGAVAGLQVEAVLKKPVEPALLLDEMRLALERSRTLRKRTTHLRGSPAPAPPHVIAQGH